AVVAGHNLSIVDPAWIQIPEKKCPPIHPLHVELLIKIAVVNLPTPSHTQGVAAHEAVNGRGVKRADQQFHIFLELIVMAQVSGKTADGKIGNAVKFVKYDTKMAFELAFVIQLEFCLLAWQKRADRIVNEMQW